MTSGWEALEVDCHLEEVAERRALVVVQVRIALGVGVQEHAEEAEAGVHVDVVVPGVEVVVVDPAITAKAVRHTGRRRLTIPQAGAVVLEELMEAWGEADDLAEQAADFVEEEAVFWALEEVRCQMESYTGMDRSLHHPLHARFDLEEGLAALVVHHEARLLTGG